ncbi:MAG TPA: type I DNA topoisomerase, partial [Pantanalinema sp.]
MSRRAIIVESPNKAKTIRQLLGAGYEVVATVGHFRDLPEKELGVAVDRDFDPTYVYAADKKDVVAKLKALKGRYKPHEIFVASDADREGEAIGWHIAETIGLPARQVQRLEFHEITREGLARAFSQVRPLDMHLVDAQQARRILDRLVGYKVSPIVRNRLPGEANLSAGRVQSVALRVVVDRELAIRAFKPTESWSVHAHYHVPGQGPDAMFEAEYVGKHTGAKAPRKQTIATREEAETIASALRALSHAVARVERKEARRNPPAPLITSTMLQQAASQLKMGTDETTRHAKALFEAGLVTYIRTDAPSVSPEFQQETLAYLRDRHGAEVVPAKPNIHKAKSANAQGAHECIRPTKLDQEPGAGIEPRARELYALITRIYLASQCRAAVFDATEAWIHAGEHALKASGRVLKQRGYLVILDDRDAKETTLPPLSPDQALTLSRVLPKQHWSKPPERFTEATLIKYLEAKGIGRPSTFASMVSLILRKEFVT